MGKKGQLLREQKKKTVTYTFTAEQLQEHDKLVIREHEAHLISKVQPSVEKAWAEREASVKKVIQDEWDARAKEFQDNDDTDNFLNLLQYFCAISCRVLIEHFRWKPIPKDGHYDRRNRTMRYADLLADEIGKISENEMMDIRQYSEQTYELYGVRFTASEVE